VESRFHSFQLAQPLPVATGHANLSLSPYSAGRVLALIRKPCVRKPFTLYVAIIGLAAVVFAADLFTALGVAIWIFYFVPIGLTLLGRDAALPILAALTCSLLIVVTSLTDQRGITQWVGYLNRGFGIIVI
jgi:hypothetical protein